MTISYLQYNNTKYLLPQDCSLSTGNSCLTKDRKMNDGSGTSYSITTFVKPQVNTYSLSFGLSSIEYPDLMGEVYKWDSLVGKVVDFTYCNIPFKSVIISDMSVIFALDGTNGINGLTLDFSLKDNLVITGKASRVNVKTNVRFN